MLTLVFNSIKVKNFLSYGNAPTTWDLSRHSRTLVVGKNGHGKSAVLLDGICFALFGKPYRKVTKGQLVNSINKKDCSVEIEFRTNGKDYKIVRGIKPNVLKIFENGTELDEEAANGDTQEFIEKQIIKLNFKTFCQVVILGKAAFIPFMKLNAAQRREVVDDVLDVSVYTTMLQVLKEDIAAVNKEVSSVEQKIELAKQATVSQKKIIALLEENKEEKIAEIDLAIHERQEYVETLNAGLVKVRESKSLIVPPPAPSLVDLEECKAVVATSRAEIKRNDQISSRVSGIETCPTCLQGVSHDHRHGIKEELDRSNQEHYTKIDEMNVSIVKIEQQIKVFGEYEEKLELLDNEIKNINSALASEAGKISALLAQKEKITSESGRLDEEKEALKKIASGALQLVQERAKLKSKQLMQEVSLVMLKDTGIKASVIKEYLPVLNKLINYYLGIFNFYADFNLDENFDETIKSRGRDDFTYESFSEGQKEKINYAILFALRQLAALKNSASINLLVLDEVLDGSLDPESRDAFLSLLESQLPDSNVFVISHSEANPGIYDAMIKVELRGDFSEYSFIE